MIIARELRKQNIAEYLIYMFQLEDLIRAHHADINKLYEAHIKHFAVDKQQLQEIKEWYATFCKMMKEENILEKGHLQFLKHKISELESFHYQLMQAHEEQEYQQLFMNCKEDIEIFREKSGFGSDEWIEPALTALYSILLLRMKKAEITKETTESIDRISRWMAVLAQRFKDFETGQREIF